MSGSKYPVVEASGSQSHARSGFGNQALQIVVDLHPLDMFTWHLEPLYSPPSADEPAELRHVCEATSSSGSSLHCLSMACRLPEEAKEPHVGLLHAEA